MDGIKVQGTSDTFIYQYESFQLFRLKAYLVLLVNSIYSLPGNDTSGNGSAMISEMTTSPVFAQRGVKLVFAGFEHNCRNYHIYY